MTSDLSLMTCQDALDCCDDLTSEELQVLKEIIADDNRTGDMSLPFGCVGRELRTLGDLRNYLQKVIADDKHFEECEARADRWHAEQDD